MIENTGQTKEIKEFCLRLLTRREHSRLELIDKSVLKGFDRTESEKVIDQLTLEGWQSDQRFAESYARYRIKKGFGPVKITQELRLRGIFDFDLEPVVLELSDGWMDLIQQLYKRKYLDEGPLSPKEWVKRNRFLQQRGFTHEMIKTVCYM